MVRVILIWLMLTVLSCSIAGAAGQTDNNLYREEDRLGVFFQTAAVEGSFALYDRNGKQYIFYNRDRCSERFIPASTFKIVNALIGLDSGVIPDEDYTIRWDGTRHLDIPDWDRDHTLKSAFRASVVWYYQELARRVGEERMQRYVDTLDYGNKDIGGGIDRFWLTGRLRISQIEQIVLLQRLYESNLPVSPRAMAIVKDMMIRDQRPGLVVRGKTGLASLDGQDIGWYVGYIEKGDNVYFFATNIVSASGNPNFPRARIEITEKILKELSIL